MQNPIPHKRLKSFAMGIVSIFVATIPVIIATPEFGNVVSWAHDTGSAVLLGWGVPGVVIIFLGKAIEELWKAWRNKVRASSKGYSTASAANSAGVDTF